MAIDTVKITVNGTTVTATDNGDGTYSASLAAPNITSYNVNSGHYYPVTVTATNKAGTATTVNDQTASIGTSLRLRVLEVTAPTISVVSPTADQYLGTASPEIEFNVTDTENGSGVAISSLQLTLDNIEYTNTSPGVNVTTITNGYKVKFTPPSNLADGKHTFDVRISDNDGNYAATSVIGFNTDTIAPTLSVGTPENGSYTSNATLTVTGGAHDSTSGTPTVTITVNGVDTGFVNVRYGLFDHEITLTNGVNTIVVTATDKVGRTTTITRTVTLDTSSPVIASVVIDPNSVAVGENYTVTIQVIG